MLQPLIKDVLRKLLTTFSFRVPFVLALMKEPVLQDKRQEHIRFCKYASDLLERVSGKQPSSVGDASLEEIRRVRHQLTVTQKLHLKRISSKVEKKSLITACDTTYISICNLFWSSQMWLFMFVISDYLFILLFKCPMVKNVLNVSLCDAFCVFVEYLWFPVTYNKYIWVLFCNIVCLRNGTFIIFILCLVKTDCHFSSLDIVHNIENHISVIYSSAID